jgi:hypothetical protein
MTRIQIQHRGHRGSTRDSLDLRTPAGRSLPF